MAKKTKNNESQIPEENKQSQQNQSFKVTLNRTEKFESLLYKMERADQKNIEKSLLKFEENPASVKMKSLTNVCDSSSISIEINGLNVPLRAIGYLEKKGNERVLTLFWVGNHQDYDKVVDKGYVFQSKLESINSKLYPGITLSDIANKSNNYKIALKKDDVLSRIQDVSNNSSNSNSNNNSKKYRS